MPDRIIQVTELILREADVEVAEDDRVPASLAHAYIPAAPTAVQSTLPPPPRFVAPDPNVVEDKVCRSIVAGIVVRVNAQASKQIQAKAINAGVGDGRASGQVLVELEEL